jgi:hypothetical protein
LDVALLRQGAPSGFVFVRHVALEQESRKLLRGAAMDAGLCGRRAGGLELATMAHEDHENSRATVYQRRVALQERDLMAHSRAEMASGTPRSQRTVDTVERRS